MKSLICIISCVFFLIIFFLIFPITMVTSTIDLYFILNHKPFVTYVDCEHVLTQAASKSTLYKDVSQYMNEEIYNNLSIKTKSYYQNTQSWDDVIQVIHQEQDQNDPRLVYVDFIEYSTKQESTKWIRLRQLAIVKDENSWKIVKYIEPMKGDWYAPTYFEHVYSIILPNIK